jgi:hypothetical protein
MSGLAMSSSGLTALSTIKQIYRTQTYRRRLRPSHSETSQTATSKCEPTNDACRTATRRRRPSSTSCDVEATPTPSSPCTRWKLSATSWTTSLTASSPKRNPLESIGRHRTSTRVHKARIQSPKIHTQINQPADATDQAKKCLHAS